MEYLIILTFYATAGASTPTSYQVVIPNRTFGSKAVCEAFGEKVKARTVKHVTFDCLPEYPL